MTKQEFISKAYNKVATLGDEYIQTEGNTDLRDSGLDLMMFSNQLEQEESLWTPITVQQYIDYLSATLELNRIPYISICGCEHVIVKDGNGTIDEDWLREFVLNIIRNFPHNQLAGLQGGKAIDEYYHVTKDMWDKLNEVIFTAPTISLTATYNNQPIPAVNERGVLLTPIQLIPSVILNSGKSIQKVRYYKNGVQLGAEITNNFLVPKSDSVGIKNDTTYTIEIDFEVGGTLTASTTILFGLPVWHGLALGDATTADIQILTKRVVLPTKSLDFTFIFPDGNVNDETPLYAYALVPEGFGTLTKALEYNNPSFNGIEDWITNNTVVTLADGFITPYKLEKFKNITQGTFNPFFKWH